MPPFGDDFLRERWLSRPRWEAELGDGSVVTQDDGRPGSGESAWLRLARAVAGGGPPVVGLQLRVRDEPPVRLPDAADGYFFREGLAASLFSGEAVGYALAGHLESGRVFVTRYLYPELTPAGSEVRDPLDETLVGESLIRRMP